VKCKNCKKNPSEVNAIINGVYYANLCKNCKAIISGNTVSSGHARWNRSIDAEDHEQDIQQPYGKDGKPNPMFSRLYPKQAKAVFTEKQMRDANS
jgi:hypothetical protein